MFLGTREFFQMNSDGNDAVEDSEQDVVVQIQQRCEVAMMGPVVVHPRCCLSSNGVEVKVI